MSDEKVVKLLKLAAMEFSERAVQAAAEAARFTGGDWVSHVSRTYLTGVADSYLKSVECMHTMVDAVRESSSVTSAMVDSAMTESAAKIIN